MEDKLYWYWFCAKLCLPLKKQKRWMHLLGHPKELFHLNPSGIEEKFTKQELKRFSQWKDEDCIQKSYEDLQKQQIHFYTYKEAGYPRRLKKLYDFPFGIFQKGRPYREKALAIAIVGSRNSTVYGMEISRIFARELAKNGVQIVSGLAKGIDGSAHREIADMKESAVGVLGCGIDQIYPRDNFQLFYKMYENQTIFSEYPPGIPPYSRNFPQRNRIISGLSDGVLVVEAKKRSGSLITADCALEQNKEVFAVPGPITDQNHAGCHGLIKEGAKLTETMEDILSEFPKFRKKSENFKTGERKSLAYPEKKVYDILSLNPKHLDEILHLSGCAYKEVIQSLFFLEANGYIRQIHQNLYIKCEKIPT